MLERSRSHWGSLLGVGMLVLVVAVMFFGANRFAPAEPWLIPTPTRVDETLIPTPTAGQLAYNPRRDTFFEAAPQSIPEQYSLRWRIGIGVPDRDPQLFQWPEHRPGWFLNWTTFYRASEDLTPPGSSTANPLEGLGMDFTPMVRTRTDRLVPSARELRILAARFPGRIWLIGNEPDVRWQDNVVPEVYAELYHEAYTAIKSVDPTAQVAIAGLSQITPLRLAYLNRIWAAYQERYGVDMPVDIWNMHVFVLREEAGNWGVGIPPGFDDVASGILWEIEQHDDLSFVEAQIRLMRQWMADHGQRDKELYITEYGVLMPPEYGFPPSRVIDFLIGSYDLFWTLRDPDLGYPADDHRLVQRWVWFSTRDPLYPTGDLFDQDGNPLPVMRAINGYIRANTDTSLAEGERLEIGD
jgi:hypothetical protein